MAAKRYIDLRSDTVTQPTPEMRARMATADVGDDQYGEDPSVNALQDRVADLLGKECAMFLPSSTMANQIALKLLTKPGDNVLVAEGTHVMWHEAGGAAANSGVQFTVVGTGGGLFTTKQLNATIQALGRVFVPKATLLVLENTHNRAGGVALPISTVSELCATAKSAQISCYLDGARLFNASLASGTSVRDLASPFDVASISLSKGLGCPAGSVIAGSNVAMRDAVRIRRMFGGAMRQSGILAAAGLYALDHNVARLANDHQSARIFAERIANGGGMVDIDAVQTNIVYFDLTEQQPDAPTLVELAAKHGVLLTAFSHRRVRAMTHMDVTQTDCESAANIVIELLRQ